MGQRLDHLLSKMGDSRRVAYAGRGAAAASATGIMEEHQHEVQELFKQAFLTEHKELLYKPTKVIHDKTL